MARNEYSDNELILGDRIDVSYENQTGISNIQDITDDDKFVISVPTVKSIPLHIPNNENIIIVYYRPNGIFSFDAIKLKEFRHDVMPALEVKVKPPVRKMQRRDFVRHEKVLPVKLRVIVTAEDVSKTNIDTVARELYSKNPKGIKRPIKDDDIIIDGFTLDMSGGGLRLLTKEGFEANTVLECTLDLMNKEFITADAVVIRSTKREIDGKSTDEFATSVRFVNISERVRQNLMKYIFDDQVKSRKKKNDI